MASRLVGAAVLLASVAAFVACSSSSYTEAEGTESGPCYPNGTCNAGLTCASGRCMRSDSADGGSSSGGNDGSTSEASTNADGASDASAESSVGACSLPSSAPLLQCEDNGNPVTCTGLQHCCVDENTACTTAACGARTMECLSEASCGDGQVCCAQVGSITAIGCPAMITKFASSHCASTCLQSELTLCFEVASCEQGQKCDPAVLDIDYRNDGSVTKLKVGVCK